MKTRFANHLELAELPFFELRDGDRLALAEPELGPIIDCHTHLALAYGRRMPLDLGKVHERVRHYLSLERPLDLDVYINQNFDAAGLKRMKRDLTLGSLTTSGMRVTHTAANLVAEMKDLGIAASVILPIDLPCLSWNAETYLKVSADRRELVSLGSVHPHARNAGDKLEAQRALGARGIKVHPALQLVAPDNPRAMKLYRLCGELGLLVLWHCGPVGIEPRLGRYLSQLKHYWRAVAENPRTTFVLGHAGALQMERALELAQRYPNVHLELASQSLSQIERIIAEAPPDRILLGSDWPFYHQATAVAKGLMATEGRPEMRRRILWENAARLFGIELEGH